MGTLMIIFFTTSQGILSNIEAEEEARELENDSDEGLQDLCSPQNQEEFEINADNNSQISIQYENKGGHRTGRNRSENDNPDEESPLMFDYQNKPMEGSDEDMSVEQSSQKQTR